MHTENAYGYRLIVLCWLLAIYLGNCPLYAQDLGNSLQFDEFLSSYLEEFDEENISYIYDEMLELWNRPLDLNICSDDDIQALPMLDLHEKEALTEYLRRYRPLESVSELLLVFGWTPMTLKKVRPFFCVGKVEASPQPNLGRELHYGKWQLRQKADIRLGAAVVDSSYRGSRLAHAYQLVFDGGRHLQWGLCFDKDEGETWGDHKGGFLELKDIKALRQLIVGDFRVSFGQGLVLSSGLFGGKSTATQTLLTNTRIFRPQRSWAESGYFRGLATQVELVRNTKASTTLAAFCSLQAIDTNLKEGYFTSLKTDGLHRTDKDQAKHGNVQRRVCGLRLQQRYGLWQWAVNGLYYQFNYPWQPQWQAYNHFYFRGRCGGNVSTDWRCRMGLWFWGGELAFDHHGQRAAIMHLNGKAGADMNLFISLRSFQKSYQAPFAATFSAKSAVSNEEGVFLAADCRLLPQCNIRCYVDCYRFPWLRNGVNAPSTGWDSQIEADWAVNRQFSVKLRYKEKQQLKNAKTALAGVRPVQQQLTRSVKCQLLMEEEPWSFKSQVLWMGSGRAASWCLAQEAAARCPGLPLRGSLLFALFDGDKGLNHYLYSTELAGGMPFANLSGQGQYLCLVLAGNPSSHSHLQVRAKSTFKEGQSSLWRLGCVLTFKF